MSSLTTSTVAAITRNITQASGCRTSTVSFALNRFRIKVSVCQCPCIGATPTGQSQPYHNSKNQSNKSPGTATLVHLIDQTCPLSPWRDRGQGLQIRRTPADQI